MSALLFSMFSVAALGADVQCPTDTDRAHLTAFRDRLAGAESPEKAKKLALSKIRLSRRAIDQAARIVPDADGVAEAADRLDTFEERVSAARTQDEVAAEFDRLATSAVSCQYDTVEIVVIVIGFVLGVLPGILFLFLFC